jgi:hypothetical protein
VTVLFVALLSGDRSGIGTELYNVLLEDSAAQGCIFVEGIRCATLGLSDLPPAMRHPFYADRERVREEEMIRSDSYGYHAGRVEVDGVRRENGKVSGFNSTQSLKSVSLVGQASQNRPCSSVMKSI